MKHFTACFLILFIPVFIQAQKLKSPDKNLTLSFLLNEKGEAYYGLKYKNKDVIKNSQLGFLISSPTPFAEGFKITNTQFSSSDTSWTPVLGEQKTIRDNHNEMLISLQQAKTGYQLNIRFRLFNDGMGFRYEFPIQKNLRHFRIDEELTEFNLAHNCKAFWIPADYDTNEFRITTSRISEISSLITTARDEP